MNIIIIILLILGGSLYTRRWKIFFLIFFSFNFFSFSVFNCNGKCMHYIKPGNHLSIAINKYISRSLFIKKKKWIKPQLEMEISSDLKFSHVFPLFFLFLWENAFLMWECFIPCFSHMWSSSISTFLLNLDPENCHFPFFFILKIFFLFKIFLFHRYFIHFFFFMMRMMTAIFSIQTRLYKYILN